MKTWKIVAIGCTMPALGLVLAITLLVNFAPTLPDVEPAANPTPDPSLASPPPAAPKPRMPISAALRECARQYDALKGAGFTLEAAERLEITCQGVPDPVPEGCGPFLAAAGRTGFKAAAFIRSDSESGPLAQLT